MVTKLFVRVPLNTHETLNNIITKSTETESNRKKIYFIEDLNQIVLNGIAYGVDPKTSNEIKSLINVIGGLEEADDGTLTVDFSSTNYAKASKTVVAAIGALDAKLKEELVKLENSKTLDTNYEFTGKLMYVAAAEGKPARIAIADETGTEIAETSINVSDIIGNGVLDHSEYVKETGILHLWFKQADGSTKDTEINLAEMLDIDDVLVKSGSENYLEVKDTTKLGYRLIDEPHTEITVEAYNALPEEEKAKYEAINEHGFEIGTKIVNVAEASDSKTGLADAKHVKDYVDGKTTDLAITAKGDEYVEASVNADVDKKRVIVAANVQNITYTPGTHATYDDEGAKLTDPVAANISGVDKSLVDGKQAITAIKSYIDFVTAEEALRSDAKVLASIKGLDKESATVDGSNVHVTYKEEDGIVTIESVDEDYATVTRKETTSTAVTPATDASLIVTAGDEAKLVKASDLKAVANYAADKVTEEAHRIDKEINDLTSYATGADTGNYISVRVDNTSGKITGVTVEFDPWETYGEVTQSTN